jgi:hypothetical protein
MDSLSGQSIWNLLPVLFQKKKIFLPNYINLPFIEGKNQYNVANKPLIQEFYVPQKVNKPKIVFPYSLV